MAISMKIPDGREPLVDYPWKNEIDRLLIWLRRHNSDTKCFSFDLIMSLAFIDATSGLVRFLEHCPHLPVPFNLHLGFINLCSPCLEGAEKWVYQKAAKPQSGALGKLSSEVILRFVQKTSNNLASVRSIGGVSSIDAILTHRDGFKILAEVKSAPLITYPVVFKIDNLDNLLPHQKPNITNSQFLELDSALYMHEAGIIPLGKPRDSLWPFKAAVDYVLNPSNGDRVKSAVNTWIKAKNAYSSRNRKDPLYYLANASGRPPKAAVDKDGWPQSESISDGKTSAGMDRTDDIKKGIFQMLKIGTIIRNMADSQDYKTALISNLPAYRHGEDYVEPFVDILWGLEGDIEDEHGRKIIARDNLRRIFDYIITIDSPVLRELSL